MSNALATLARQTIAADANASAAKAKKAAATKKAATTKKAVTVKATASTFKFAIVTGRPSAGARLQSFTAAWLDMAGMMKGRALDKAIAQQVAGHTAIAYHLREGRMTEANGRVSLTAGGVMHFAARKINEEERDAWKSILRTGKPDGVLVKNAACIRAL